MDKRPDSKTIENSCFEALVPLGVKVKYGIGMFPISDDFSGSIYINLAVHPSFIRVNPSIGIHCYPVMKLVYEAAGEKYQKGRWPTLRYPLGVACPDVDQFIFEKIDDIFPESTRLAHVIEKYAFPFIHGLANFQAVLPRIFESVDSLSGGPEIFSAATYLSGNEKGALDFLEKRIAELNERNASQAEPLRQLLLHLSLR